MKKLLNVLGKIFIGAWITIFAFNVIMFAVTADTGYGIWAILIALSMHVSGKIEISVKGR